MKIHAKLFIGRNRITSAWDLFEMDAKSFFVLYETKDAKVLIPIKKSWITKNSDGELWSLGKPNIADAMLFRLPN